MKWAWIWFGCWTFLTVDGAIELLVDGSVHGIRYLTLAAGLVIWAVTMVRWLPRRLPLVALWKGSYTGFSIAYVVLALSVDAAWQVLTPFFMVIVVYLGILENDRYMDWLNKQDPTTAS